MLELRLFGPGRARYLGRQLVGFPTEQGHLLLCYLLPDQTSEIRHTPAIRTVAASTRGGHMAQCWQHYVSKWDLGSTVPTSDTFVIPINDYDAR